MFLSIIKKFNDLLFFNILFSFIIFSNKTYNSYQLPKVTFLLLLILLLLIIVLFSNRSFKVNLINLLFIIYLFYIFIHILTSAYNPPYYYILTLIIPICFITPLFFDLKIKKVLIFVNIIIFVSVLYGITQFVLLHIRPYSFFGNPIFFGEFIMINFPLILLSFLYFNKKIFFFINILLCILAIFLSASRSVLIITLISFVLFTFILKKINFIKKFTVKNLYLFIALFLLILFFLIPSSTNFLKFSLNRFYELITLKSDDIKTRMLIIEASMNMIKENSILGNGVGAFKYLYPKYQSEVIKKHNNIRSTHTSYVHNDYMQILVETGFIGLFLFLYIVFYTLFIFFKNCEHLSDLQYVFSIAIMCSLFSYMLEGFFNFPFYIMPSAGIFWLYLGILNSFIINKDKHNKQDNFISKIFLIICIIIIIKIFLIYPSYFISDFYVKYGIVKSKPLKPHHEQFFKKAVESMPLNYDAYKLMAKNYGLSLEIKESINSYLNALKIYPYSADILYNMGTLYAEEKDYENAEKYLKKAIALCPDFVNAHLKLAKILYITNKKDQSIFHLQIAQKYSPGIISESTLQNLMLFKENTSILFEENAPKTN